MTYNPNIPQPNDRPSQSQSQILTNFQQLANVFGQDHVSYTDGTVANRGKHNQSTYLFQSGDPSTAANEGAVYVKNNGLYFREQSNGNVIEILGGGGGGGTPIPGTNGSVPLPGGMIMKWGVSAFTGRPSTATFVTPFPSNCWVVTQGETQSSALNIANITTSGFQWAYGTGITPSGQPMYYIAIGN